MTAFKHLFFLLSIGFIAIQAASGQTGGNSANADTTSTAGSEERSVEESYLQDAVEMMIIRETSHSESLDQKMLALQYIGEAIDRGNTGEDIRQTLEFLSMEGVMIQGRENGRLVNNYPLARREAAKYLGQIGTVEAKEALLNICKNDPEPMVLQEAIKALGDIGNNDNDRTVAAIVWIVNRYNALNPDNLMALSAVDAIAKISEKNGGIRDPGVAQLLIRIAEGPYIKPVQNKAKMVLSNLRRTSSDQSRNNNQNQAAQQNQNTQTPQNSQSN